MRKWNGGHLWLLAAISFSHGLVFYVYHGHLYQNFYQKCVLIILIIFPLLLSHTLTHICSNAFQLFAPIHLILLQYTMQSKSVSHFISINTKLILSLSKQKKVSLTMSLNTISMKVSGCFEMTMSCFVDVYIHLFWNSPNKNHSKPHHTTQRKLMFNEIMPSFSPQVLLLIMWSPSKMHFA